MISLIQLSHGASSAAKSLQNLGARSNGLAGGIARNRAAVNAYGQSVANDRVNIDEARVAVRQAARRSTPRAAPPLTRGRCTSSRPPSRTTKLPSAS